jgi:hypothetical protein
MVLWSQSTRCMIVIVLVIFVIFHDEPNAGCIAKIGCMALMTSSSNIRHFTNIRTSYSLLQNRMSSINYYYLLKRRSARHLLIRAMSLPLSYDEYTDIDQQQLLLLQQLQEPFDRWRYLQKLLDEDINNGTDILFLLKISIQHQLQSKQQEEMSKLRPLTKSSTLEMISQSNVTTNISITKLDDSDENIKRRQAMEYILYDVSNSTIHNLLQFPMDDNTVEPSPNELYCLQRLDQLLPNPEMDEDASKGLWDTVIELHGREAVKINERQQSIAWKTRCTITRVLIYYDFLSDGLQHRPT